MRPVFKLARWGGSQRGSCKFARSFVPEVYDGVVRQIMPFYDITQSETVDITRIIKPEVTQWLDTGCGTGNLVENGITIFP